MNARDTVLSRIREALSGSTPPDAPPVVEVWPSLRPSTEEMAAQFARELAAVHGESHRCQTLDEARGKLAELLAAGGWQRLGVVDRPLCRELTVGLGTVPIFVAEGHKNGSVPFGGAKEETTPDPFSASTMAELPVGLIAADALLADTGSAVVACHTAQERLMCYLPPVCIVAARAEQLAEHLPAAWDIITRYATEPQATGEVVLITGPSRTADIEKTLILGAHGPKRLIALIVGSA